MAYHHASGLDIINNGKPLLYIINRRLYHFRNDDIQGSRLDLFTRMWYNKLTDK